MSASACLVYLASPRAWEHLGILRRDMLAASLRSAAACLPERLPVLVFHEDYTEEDRAFLSEILPCEFHEVDFVSGSEHFVPHRRPLGYMMMCRFWSGVVQRHPALQRFSHYIRLDDDSFFTNPKMTPETLRRMLRCDYSYRLLFGDWSPEHEQLYRFTEAFLRGEGLFAPAIDLVANGRYTGQAIYNNFHCASLRLWRDPLVARYVEAIEAEHGCLRRGWMDANVHALIAWNILPHTDLVLSRETLFGYRHNYHMATIGNASLQFEPWKPFVVEESEYT